MGIAVEVRQTNCPSEEHQMAMGTKVVREVVDRLQSQLHYTNGQLLLLKIALKQTYLPQ